MSRKDIMVSFTAVKRTSDWISEFQSMTSALASMCIVECGNRPGISAVGLDRRILDEIRLWESGLVKNKDQAHVARTKKHLMSLGHVRAEGGTLDVKVSFKNCPGCIIARIHGKTNAELHFIHSTLLGGFRPIDKAVQRVIAAVEKAA